MPTNSCTVKNKKEKENKKSGGTWIRNKDHRANHLLFILPIINYWITQSTQSDSE